MASSYGRFAEVYDALMTDIPYDAYVEWVQTNAPAKQNTKLLDIGCGTGTMAIAFAKSGYDVSGLDLSEEMLMIASERCYEEDVRVFFVCQSMDELDGFEQLDVVTIPIDSLNYVPEQQAVQQMLGQPVAQPQAAMPQQQMMPGQMPVQQMMPGQMAPQQMMPAQQVAMPGQMAQQPMVSQPAV